jgi:hypothetical protein
MLLLKFGEEAAPARGPIQGVAVMQKIRSAIVCFAVLVITLGSFALSAYADAAATTTTFVLAAGTLSISAPATSNLGNPSVTAGASSFSGQLGSVSVSDTRGNLVSAWTATVSTTSFTTGGATSNETVTGANISYASGTLTTSGVGTFTGQPGATLGTSKTAASLAAGVGNNSASWNPTLTFTLLSSQVAGTYTGTVTHSVA